MSPYDQQAEIAGLRAELRQTRLWLLALVVERGGQVEVSKRVLTALDDSTVLHMRESLDVFTLEVSV